MVEIKNTISFDEYTAIVNKVVNDCFIDDTYSPANYELSFRTALLLAFAPDYDLSGCTDNNELWEKVMNDEASEILAFIRQNRTYYCLEESIDNAIDYRIKLIASSPMSMSDIALSKLIETFAKKVEEIDTNMLTKDDVNAISQVTTNINSSDNMNNLVNAMLDNGLLAKPNRETRRKNGQRSKSNIKVANKESDE